MGEGHKVMSSLPHVELVPVTGAATSAPVVLVYQLQEREGGSLRGRPLPNP